MALDVSQEYPGYASLVTAEAIARRERFPPNLRLKMMELMEMLALNPRGFENRTQRLPVGKNIYIYTHPNPPIELTYQLEEGNDPKVIRFVHFAAIMMDVKRTLFISYSHKDKKWLDEIVKYLKGLETQDIALWSDDDIKASARWRDEIDRALADAKAALLLVSQDFIASDFISQKELPSLLKKAETEGLKIFWIPLEPSTVKSTPISEFQSAVDDPSIPVAKLGKTERKEQFVRVYERIAEAMAL